MMGVPQPEDDQVGVAMQPFAASETPKTALQAAEIERVLSPDDLQKNFQDYDRVDAEVAKYANGARIDISPEENKRLRRLIDKRVLTIMV